MPVGEVEEARQVECATELASARRSIVCHQQPTMSKESRRASVNRWTTPRIETTFGTLRDELFFLGEAPEQLDGYPFAGRIAAKQSRSIELRTKIRRSPTSRNVPSDVWR